MKFAGLDNANGTHAADCQSVAAETVVGLVGQNSTAQAGSVYLSGPWSVASCVSRPVPYQYRFPNRWVNFLGVKAEFYGVCVRLFLGRSISKLFFS